jgi:hypothetical protein
MGENMNQNATVSEILNEIEKAIQYGKKSVDNLEADEDFNIEGKDDCHGAFDNISGYLDDLRGRLHGIADTIGDMESELSDA